MNIGLLEVFEEFNGRLHGFGRVVIAGGAVRDYLLDRIPKDYDVFVLQGSGFDYAKAKEQIASKLSDLTSIPLEIEWHNSEPFLVTTVEWNGAKVQILVNPAQTLRELVSSFDWNVCLFAYDRTEYFRGEELENIGYGKDLKLQKVTFPLSTLRRGFRFSERFKMKLPYSTIVGLCREIIKRHDAGNIKGPTGNEPDMKALAANVLVDDK